MKRGSVVVGRLAAIVFCLVPLYTALLIAVSEPPRDEWVLWLGVEALMLLATILNLMAAFSGRQQPALWLVAFLGSSAVALFVLIFALYRHESSGLVLLAITVGPILTVSLKGCLSGDPDSQEGYA